VIATQNPIDFHGTYPLPEAQLDRFLVQLHLGYPDEKNELAVLYNQQDSHPVENIQPVLSRDEVLALQDAVKKVHVEQNVGEYLVRIVRASREEPRLKLGVSPRGSLMLFRAAQAAAYTSGRDFVLPDDVQRLAPYVLPHRMILTAKSRYGSVQRVEIIHEILDKVPVPT
jgi:MoxR-like ATPase